MATARKANVIADQTILARLPKAAFKVVSWDNSHSPATQNAVQALSRANGWCEERIFDAAHGRRYVLFIYPMPAPGMRSSARNNCYDTLAAS